MPPGVRKSRVRPDPVSCQSCRSKKLKCNRVHPCSNCSARGLSCDFLVPPKRQFETHISTQSSVELLERIERLEALIQSVPTAQNSSNHGLGSSYSSGRQIITPSPESILLADLHQTPDEDSMLLENIGARDDFIVSDHITPSFQLNLSSVDSTNPRTAFRPI